MCQAALAQQSRTELGDRDGTHAFLTDLPVGTTHLSAPVTENTPTMHLLLSWGGNTPEWDSLTLPFQTLLNKRKQTIRKYEILDTGLEFTCNASEM